MNRVGLGLAVGAGYVLGRTRKLKLAFAVGTLVAGKRMHLSPRALADLLSQQLLNNPQFKEIGDQLREDLRGVGKAASGAMVERQIDAIADRLHGRTAAVRDQLAGVVPEPPETGLGGDEAEDAEEEYDEEPEPEPEPEEEPEEPAGERPAGKAPAKKAATREASAKKTAAKKTAATKAAATKTAAKKAPGKKAAAEETPAKKARGKKAAAKKTTSARRTAARTASRARLPKGGGER
ncbi:DNA primase [Streptomyces sp. HUAS ZL42]|uniref:DNA primase n=1 Tax=Streptomyces sp. HUAS ZL42 TaxID=3231715 RepID=UPI00345F135F